MRLQHKEPIPHSSTDRTVVFETKNVGAIPTEGTNLFLYCMIIAFDVDGTLITFNDKVRRDIVQLLINLSQYHRIIVWSGGGKDYAEMWVRRLFLEDYVTSCHTKPVTDIQKNSFFDGQEKQLTEVIDICFDDECVDLAKVNVKI